MKFALTIALMILGFSSAYAMGGRLVVPVQDIEVNQTFLLKTTGADLIRFSPGNAPVPTEMIFLRDNRAGEYMLLKVAGKKVRFQFDRRPPFRSRGGQAYSFGRFRVGHDVTGRKIGVDFKQMNDPDWHYYTVNTTESCTVLVERRICDRDRTRRRPNRRRCEWRTVEEWGQRDVTLEKRSATVDYEMDFKAPNGSTLGTLDFSRNFVETVNRWEGACYLH